MLTVIDEEFLVKVMPALNVGKTIFIEKIPKILKFVFYSGVKSSN
jgi:hypothetical protein